MSLAHPPRSPQEELALANLQARSVPAIALTPRPGGHRMTYVDTGSSYFRWSGSGIWTEADPGARQGSPVEETFAANLEEDFMLAVEAGGLAL